MLEKLKRALQPLVEVRISPERIELRQGEANLSLAPVVRVYDGKILAVGDEARTQSEGELVEFFAKPHRRGREWKPEAEFQIFIRYALMLLQQEKLLFIKPYIRVSGASALADILDGQQDEILTRAFRNAGAAHVEIVDHARSSQ